MALKFTRPAGGVPLHQLDLLCLRHLDEHRLDVVHLGNHPHVPATQSAPWSRPACFLCLSLIHILGVYLLFHHHLFKIYDTGDESYICVYYCCCYDYYYCYVLFFLYIYI